MTPRNRLRTGMLTWVAVALLVGSFSVGCRRGSAKSESEPHHERQHDTEVRHEAEEHGDLHGDDVDHEGDVDAEVVRLAPKLRDDLGIVVSTAGPGHLKTITELPGQVHVNDDHLAHVTPRVSGVVREVLVTLGDHVRKGQVVAELESRELADAVSEWLAARQRLALTEKVAEREKRLFEQRVSAEQDYLDATTARAEAQIDLQSAEQKLRTLGMDPEELDRSVARGDRSLTRYTIRAPMDGTVIQKHMTRGENVGVDSTVLTVADLSTVWIDLQVYPRDLASIRRGQEARLHIASTNHVIEETIAFVQPLLGEDTRTALARIVANNPDGRFKPGMFVTAEVVTGQAEAEVVIPRSAIVRMEDGHEVVFVPTHEGFAPRMVTAGRSSSEAVEIVSGLRSGDRFVAGGAFKLKAELGTAGFGSHVH